MAIRGSFGGVLSWLYFKSGALEITKNDTAGVSYYVITGDCDYVSLVIFKCKSQTKQMGLVIF